MIAADIVLDTPRLELARFRAEDRAAHRALLDTPDIARLLPVPAPISDEMAAAVFEQILALPPEQGFHLAIWRKQPRALIGSIGVHIDARDRHGALSIALADTADRRQGLGTEAARALIAHAFAAGVRKVWFNHHGTNAAVRVAAERLGFREVGRQVRHCLLDDVWVDWVTMELFAEDWRSSVR